MGRYKTETAFNEAARAEEYLLHQAEIAGMEQRLSDNLAVLHGSNLLKTAFAAVCFAVPLRLFAKRESRGNATQAASSTASIESFPA